MPQMLTLSNGRPETILSPKDFEDLIDKHMGMDCANYYQNQIEQLSELISISDDTKEIRKEITDVKVKVNDLSERVVMVEQSTKSAHHRLDRYEEEEIYHGKPRKRWWV